MFKGSFNVERLRVNLRLVINRLKLLEKKKSKSQFLEKKEHKYAANQFDLVSLCAVELCLVKFCSSD